MSGFVIAYSYEEKIPQLGVGRFMVVRLIRFLPLFYLGGFLGLLRLGMLYMTSKPDSEPLASIAYFLFLPAPPGSAVDNSISPLNGPGWSLLLEIYINLAFAVVLPRLTTRAVLSIAGAAGSVLAIGLLRGAELGGPHWSDLAFGAVRVTFSFSLGVAIYRLREQLTFTDALIWPALLPLAVAMFIPASPAWSAMFVFFISPAVVILALREGRESWIARYGAASSYCIYAIHWPLLLIADGAGRRLPFGTAPVVLSSLAVLLIAAPFVDRRFDLPTRRLLKKFAEGLLAGASDASARESSAIPGLVRGSRNKGSV
jgi:peptidoglycan/LPS O-acetylase OafA/YrhL